MYKAAAQLRQEVKQKAKRAVEKAFLMFSLPQSNSPSSTPVEDYQRILEARIQFVKTNDLFHHGKVQMPDPSMDPAVCNHSAASYCLLTAFSSGPSRLTLGGRSMGRSSQT